MKIATLLRQLRSGQLEIAQPRRSFGWSRGQVRELFESLYRRYPVGSIVVWALEVDDVEVNVVLDGHQRASAIYAIAHGQPPMGVTAAATGELYFHVATEELRFESEIEHGPLWVSVTKVLSEGIGGSVADLAASSTSSAELASYADRLGRLLSILEIDVPVVEIAGGVSLDEACTIVERLNRPGTQLSRSDMVASRIAARCPDAPERMWAALARWRRAGFRLSSRWLLAMVSAISYGAVDIDRLSGASSAHFLDGLTSAEWAVDRVLHLIAARFGLDGRRIPFGSAALIVMAHYVHRAGGELADAQSRDLLLGWYLHSSLAGRLADATDDAVNADLRLIDPPADALDRLHAALGSAGDVGPAQLAGWGRASVGYPLLHLLTRECGSLEWLSGEPVARRDAPRLETRYIFPRQLLYRHGYNRREAAAVANMWITGEDHADTPKDSDGPGALMRDVEARHPGALASHWIPTDPDLWRVERFFDFLAERRRLLANATNDLLARLRRRARSNPAPGRISLTPPPGGRIYTSDERERAIGRCRAWLRELGLSDGVYAHTISREPSLVCDVGWPEGVGSTAEPLALVLGCTPQVAEQIAAEGYRVFTSTGDLRVHVSRAIQHTSRHTPTLARD